MQKAQNTRFRNTMAEIADLEDQIRFLNVKLENARRFLTEQFEDPKELQNLDDWDLGIKTPVGYNDDQIYKTWKTSFDGAQALKDFFPQLSLYYLFILDSSFEGLVILTNYQNQDAGIISAAINSLNENSAISNIYIRPQSGGKMRKFENDVLDQMIEL